MNIFLSKDVVPDINGLKIYFDGDQKDYEAVSLDDVWFIHLSYQHSIHTIRMILTTALPTYTSQPLTTLITSIVTTLVIALTIALIPKEKIQKKHAYLHPFFKTSKNLMRTCN